MDLEKFLHGFLNDAIENIITTRSSVLELPK